ncbi:MAG: diaminopimelate decarboxylase [Bacteroidetes bacterium]|nr:diaminopimelate decarboxylase [Bacteroidota bacterium]
MENNTGKHRIQGLSFRSLADQFGTPLYIYDSASIISQISTLRSKVQDIKIKYAAKALTNLSILKLMRRHGVGVDVVSIQEAQIARLAGYESREIMFTPNSVSFDEIVAGVEMGLNINLDNLPMLEKFGAKYGNSYPCCLRLNPNIMAGGNYKISTGHSHSKFGINILQKESILNNIKRYNIQVNGLHIHTGSEILDLDVFQKMSDILFGLAEEFTDVNFLDFGGGIKVAYKAGEPVTDIEALGKMLSDARETFARKTGRKLELWMEPGKFLVSEAGYLLVRTNVVKETPAVTFVGVDSGLNQLVRPMMYDAYHEIVNVSNTGGEKKVYTVVGNVCETDTFGKDRELHEVHEGDLLVILNAGAYGYSMASNYNSRLRPAEVLIHEGVARLIRKRDTLEQILLGQIDVFE